MLRSLLSPFWVTQDKKKKYFGHFFERKKLRVENAMVTGFEYSLTSFLLLMANTFYNLGWISIFYNTKTLFLIECSEYTKILLVNIYKSIQNCSQNKVDHKLNKLVLTCVFSTQNLLPLLVFSVPPVFHSGN